MEKQICDERHFNFTYLSTYIVHTIDCTQTQTVMVFEFFHGINPNWHELWKQEKCSSLAPPSGIFYKTQWARKGIKLIWLMSSFTSEKVLKFLIKLQLAKSGPKRTRGWKVPYLIPIRVNIMLVSKEECTTALDKCNIMHYWETSMEFPRLQLNFPLRVNLI